jgi:GNAT superfamily N-acetyltransferase
MIATKWEPMTHADLDSINRIADAVHVSLPEKPEVFAEKLNLFPRGCCKLVSNGHIVGYGISHPWMLYSIPLLDAFLESIPIHPDCLYVHDCVVLPESRGRGCAGQYINLIKTLAIELGISNLACVSVYGTHCLWGRFGFVIDGTPINLASYGTSPYYMTCKVV